MLIPGSNILGIALTAINPTGGVEVKKYLGKQENDFGSTIKTYSGPVPVVGCSLQPMPTSMIQQLGLSLQKQYINIWTQSNIQVAYNGNEGDILIWGGAEWEVMSPTSWQEQDGWKQIIAVRQ